MTWTTFPTLTDGQVLTGAHMQIVRDDFNETAAGKATQSGAYYVGTGMNAIAERIPSSDDVDSVGLETTTSTTYTNLTTPGPAVTVTTGTRALALISAYVFNSNLGDACYVSVEVSGATSISANDLWCLQYESNSSADVLNATRAKMFDLTAGINTFTMKYRVTSGASTGNFRRRELTIMPF